MLGFIFKNVLSFICLVVSKTYAYSLRNVTKCFEEKKRCKSKNDIIVDCGIKEKNKSKQSWLYQMGENQSKSSS